MKVVYTGPFPQVETPDGKVFPNGEPVEVSKALGESLTARTDFKEGK